MSIIVNACEKQLIVWLIAVIYETIMMVFSCLIPIDTYTIKINDDDRNSRKQNNVVWMNSISYFLRIFF